MSDPLTKAELIIAELILERLPINQPFIFAGKQHGILVGAYEKYPNDYNEMAEINKFGIAKIRNYFLEEEYMKCVDSMYPKDELTEKGKKAKKLGGIKQYEEWERKDIKDKNFQDIPKKKWVPFELGKAIILILLGVAINRYILPPPKEKPDPIKDQRSDTTSKKPTSPPMPKALSKKDTF